MDINSRNASLETPLGVACRAGHLHIAKLLLEKSSSLEGSKKIQVDAKDDVGNTPIHYLAGEGIYPTWPEDRKPTENDLEEVVKLILEALDHDPKQKREFGRYCMEVACSQGSIHLMKILLEFIPKSKDLQDEDGWTALHFAAVAGDAKIVKLLLDKGANPKIETNMPGTYDAEDLAFIYGEYGISQQISQHLTPTKNEAERYELQAWKWHGKHGKQQEPADELGIDKLLKSFESIREQISTPETVWCHLPANNVSKKMRLIFNHNPDLYYTYTPDRSRANIHGNSGTG